MGRMYPVRWTDTAGTKQVREFYSRANAITFLNHLVLDLGIAVARLGRPTHRALGLGKQS